MKYFIISIVILLSSTLHAYEGPITFDFPAGDVTVLVKKDGTTSIVSNPYNIVNLHHSSFQSDGILDLSFNWLNDGLPESSRVILNTENSKLTIISDYTVYNDGSQSVHNGEVRLK